MANEKAFETALLYRGMIINAAITIEVLIDEILALYFTKENGMGKDFKMFLLTSDKIGVENKRKTLETILKNRFLNLHKEYAPILRTIQNEIYPIRNRFAHQTMEYINDDAEIGLYKVKDDIQLDWFNNHELSKWTFTAGKCGDELVNLRAKMILIFRGETKR
ncbi:hypothetical protein [Pedobacter agri]|uniref:hypothetical protein n=1 Tax=Pedobacter agri TaxID=454586 RepID=UPI002931B1E5|nr:hypothetical protein [Pedobacter agri]